MSLGITVGKFYPFHLGHAHLIQKAGELVDHLVVLVGQRPAQRVCATVRAGWIRAMFPQVEVICVPEDIPETPAAWAKRALDVLSGRRPDIAFTSESYGEPWAGAMGARHVCIDPERKAFPVSGSQLRNDLARWWHMLTGPAKAWFTRRVCVLGAESSGTTTLARDLAKVHQTAWVPEYGRWYWEGRRYTPGAEDWETREFFHIAAGQIKWEEDLAEKANKVIFCDTDPLATCVWHRRFLGRYDADLEAIADSRRYDQYLLTAPDFPFVQDGTREGELIRHRMHEWFVETLQRKNRPFAVIQGPPEARLTQAARIIDPMLCFPALTDG